MSPVLGCGVQNATLEYRKRRGLRHIVRWSDVMGDAVQDDLRVVFNFGASGFCVGDALPPSVMVRC